MQGWGKMYQLRLEVGGSSIENNKAVSASLELNDRLLVILLTFLTLKSPPIRAHIGSCDFLQVGQDDLRWKRYVSKTLHCCERCWARYILLRCQVIVRCYRQAGTRIVGSSLTPQYRFKTHTRVWVIKNSTARGMVSNGNTNLNQV